MDFFFEEFLKLFYLLTFGQTLKVTIMIKLKYIYIANSTDVPGWGGICNLAKQK